MPEGLGAVIDMALDRAVPLRVDLHDPFGRVMPKSIEDGKRGEELFTLILSGIREIYDVDGVIAGGAVRDVAAGNKGCKDVDVFLPMTPDDFLKGWEELGWRGGLIPVPKKGYEGQKCAVESLGNFHAYCQGVLVDLVFLKEPLTAQMADNFPIYTQRGVWTLGGGLRMSPVMAEDVANKQFTIDPTITDKERLKNLLDKVNSWKKRDFYKDWKVVEPDVREWW
jgi:hypothetical protein